MDHVEQLTLAPAALDIVANAACLEIRHDHLCRIFRKDKPAVQLGYRQQLLFPEGDQNFRRPTVTPLWGYLGLLVHCEAFGDPARYPPVRGGEDVNMAHLM